MVEYIVKEYKNRVAEDFTSRPAKNKRSLYTSNPIFLHFKIHLSILLKLSIELLPQ